MSEVIVIVSARMEDMFFSPILSVIKLLAIIMNLNSVYVQYIRCFKFMLSF
jgi:hypothetical protein